MPDLSSSAFEPYDAAEAARSQFTFGKAPPSRTAIAPWPSQANKGSQPFGADTSSQSLGPSTFQNANASIHSSNSPSPLASSETRQDTSSQSTVDTSGTPSGEQSVSFRFQPAGNKMPSSFGAKPTPAANNGDKSRATANAKPATRKTHRPLIRPEHRNPSHNLGSLFGSTTTFGIERMNSPSRADGPSQSAYTPSTLTAGSISASMDHFLQSAANVTTGTQPTPSPHSSNEPGQVAQSCQVGQKRLFGGESSTAENLASGSNGNNDRREPSSDGLDSDGQQLDSCSPRDSSPAHTAAARPCASHGGSSGSQGNLLLGLDVDPSREQVSKRQRKSLHLERQRSVETPATTQPQSAVRSVSTQPNIPPLLLGSRSGTPRLASQRAGRKSTASFSTPLLLLNEKDAPVLNSAPSVGSESAAGQQIASVPSDSFNAPDEDMPLFFGHAWQKKVKEIEKLRREVKDKNDEVARLMDKLHDKEIKVAQVKQAAATIVQKAKECMKVADEVTTEWRAHRISFEASARMAETEVNSVAQLRSEILEIRGGVNGYLNEAGVIGNIKTEAFTFLKTLEQQEQNLREQYQECKKHQEHALFELAEAKDKIQELELHARREREAQKGKDEELSEYRVKAEQAREKSKSLEVELLESLLKVEYVTDLKRQKEQELEAASLREEEFQKLKESLEEKLNDQRKTNEQLHFQKDDLMKVQVEIKSTIAELRERLKHKEQEWQCSQERLLTTLADKSAGQARVEELQQACATLTTERNSCSEKLVKAEAAAQQKAGALKRLEETHEKTKHSLQTLSKENERLKSLEQELREMHVTHRDQDSEKLKLQYELKAAHQDLESANRASGASQEEIGALRDKLSAVYEELSAAKRELMQSRDATTSANDAVRAAGTDKAQLTKRVEEAEARCTAVQGDLAKSNDQLAALEEASRAATLRAEKLEADISEAEERILVLTEACQESEQRLAQQQTEADAHINELKAQLEETTHALENLEQERDKALQQAQLRDIDAEAGCEALERERTVMQRFEAGKLTLNEWTLINHITSSNASEHRKEMSRKDNQIKQLENTNTSLQAKLVKALKEVEAARKARALPARRSLLPSEPSSELSSSEHDEHADDQGSPARSAAIQAGVRPRATPKPADDVQNRDSTSTRTGMAPVPPATQRDAQVAKKSRPSRQYSSRSSQRSQHSAQYSAQPDSDRSLSNDTATVSGGESTRDAMPPPPLPGRKRR